MVAGLPCLLLILLGALSGCMQVETRVRLLEDGSAVITERVRFSDRLLDASGPEGSALDVASLLKKEAALERLKQLGAGAELVSHEVRRAEQGEREALTVFRIPDLTKLRYASPFIRHPEYRKNTVVGFEIDAVKKGSYLGDKAGELRLRVLPLDALKDASQAVNEQAAEWAESSPVDLQRLRQLQPILSDLLEGLKIKFTVEAYAPIRCSFAMRGFELEGAIKEVDLMDLDAQNLDRRAGAFFANEEVLLDLLRWRLDTPNLRAQLKDANVNKTLPLLLARAGAIWFPASRPLYERYLKDVKLEFGEGHGGSRCASFEEVGYRPKDGQKAAHEQP